MEVLCVECRLQGLHADKVLELEVACRRSALAELLDEPLEAVADPLAGQKVAVLDVSPHVLGEEGLVAETGETHTQEISLLDQLDGCLILKTLHEVIIAILAILYSYTA